MATKNSKVKKYNQNAEETSATRSRKAAQIMFAVFALILILSMVLSAVKNY